MSAAERILCADANARKLQLHTQTARVKQRVLVDVDL